MVIFFALLSIAAAAAPNRRMIYPDQPATHAKHKPRTTVHKNSTKNKTLNFLKALTPVKIESSDFSTFFE